MNVDFLKTMFNVFSLYTDLREKRPDQKLLIRQVNDLRNICAMYSPAYCDDFGLNLLINNFTYQKREASLTILDHLSRAGLIRFHFNRASTTLSVKYLRRAVNENVGDNKTSMINHRHIKQIGTKSGRENALATMYLDTPLGKLAHQAYKIDSCYRQDTLLDLKQLFWRMYNLFDYVDHDDRYVHVYGYLKCLERRLHKVLD
jgi:hypothetical protein